MSHEEERRKQELSYANEIKALSSLLNSLLEKAKQSVQQSLECFISDEVRQLGAAIGGYFKCMNGFGVKTRAALEAIWSKFYQSQDIRDAVEELIEVEDNWNAFLDNVDCMLSGTVIDEDVQVSTGMHAPCDIPLINVTTKSSTSLGDMIGQRFLLLVMLRHFA